MEEEDEKELEKYILKLYTWEKLPPQIKKRLENSPQVWKEKVIKYSIKHQLRWKTNLARTMVPDERIYYQEILRVSKMNFMLYPYHISDVLVRGLRVTPFKYYLEMMQDVLQNEHSYDRLPNFTASDGVRLLGIGRNEYIDIMNRCRSKGWIWKSKKNMIKELLPTQPVELDIDYWWVINVGFVSEEDIKNCNDTEHAIIDLLIDTGPKQAGELDKKATKSLHTKGLIYIEVPIANDDRIAVPPLENFVMNRVSGDYFENLLYKIFVSTDERSSVEQLANTLDIDVEMVKQAVSMYCRLGFAKKKSVEPLLPEQETPTNRIKSKWHASWLNSSFSSLLTQSADNLLGSPPMSPNFSTTSSDDFDNENNDSSSLFDTYKPESPTAKDLLSSPTFSRAPLTSPLAIKLVRSTSDAAPAFSEPNQGKRIGFIVDYTLTALLMMGNLAPGLKSHAVTMYEVGKLADESVSDFLVELEKVSGEAEGEAQRYHDHAVTLRETLKFLRRNEQCPVPGSDGGVDILRCERLNSLESATRERILSQNYALLISMAPITNETQAITSCIPAHFGPAIPEVNSSWFTLYLYHAVGAGPPSILYPKGARVRCLPNILKNCELMKLCLWQHEPIILNAKHVLPILNDTLLDSPVLVQGYSTDNTPEIVDVPFPFEVVDTPTSVDETTYTAENLHTHPIVQKIQKVMDLQYSFGIIKMLKLDEKWVPLDVFYGIPLHDTHQNEAVCKKIKEYNLFSEQNLAKYSKQSKEMAIRLLDFIAENQVEELDLDPEHLPFPCCQLQFANGVLH